MDHRKEKSGRQMKSVLLIALVGFLFSCSTQPEPIIPGKDSCTFCKMPVADLKFGGEIISTKGKIFKFDDLGCMIHFLSGAENTQSAKSILTVSYSSGHDLADVKKSFFLVSSNLHTPMNSGTAAFKTKEEAEEAQRTLTGNILTWNELITAIR
jgi:copper chaperone NosL